VTTVLAAISFPLLILVCFWLDRYEPEPGRYRLAALGWGGVVAVVLSFLGEQVFFALPGTPDFIDTAVLAPVIEEFSKGLFLVAIVLLRRYQVHGLLDGIVYAALVGIGFAFVEDIVYYLSSLGAGGPEELGVTFFLRGVMSPFAHPLFTSATGVGIGIAVMSRSRLVQVAAPVLGYLVAVLLHATWNASATFGGARGFLLTYLVAFIPLLIVLVVIAVWARHREGRMLTRSLQECAQMGWISPYEVRWVATLSDRVSARKYAKRVGGRRAADVLSLYQQALTEMAFLHNRVVSGTAPADFNQRMYDIQVRAASLRPYVILPPAAQPPAMIGGPSGPPPIQGPGTQWSPIPQQPPQFPPPGGPPPL
jgi:RsiW-degrading membrane proteinase PrsW (M82 family)